MYNNFIVIIRLLMYNITFLLQLQILCIYMIVVAAGGNVYLLVYESADLTVEPPPPPIQKRSRVGSFYFVQVSSATKK